ncbi:MAG: hypothetical protein R2684_13950 [Pyrinomonadaceae bacterium]
MAFCPKCGSSYSDPTLRFCLTDGTELVSDSGSLGASNANEIRFDLSTPEQPTQIRQNMPQVEKAGIGTGVKVAIALLIAALLLIIVSGVALFAFTYYISDNDEPIAKESPTPEKDGNEVDDLKKKIEDLQKKVDEKNDSENAEDPSPTATATPKSTKTPASTPPPMDDEDGNGPVNLARVNSPKDGFLALRSHPDSERGQRLTKIPHNAVIVIGACQSKPIRIGSKTGRWCRTAYAGKIGWVFDAWLIKE